MARRTTLLIQSLLLALVAAVLPAVLATPATAATCAVTWGSLPKAATTTSGAQLSNVRSGRSTCYDRLVIDLNGPVTTYRVEYVAAVRADGSGAVVPLRGAGKIRVVAHAAPYDAAGHPTYTPANFTELTNVSGYTTFRQVTWAGSFEGQTTIGLGVRARLPFRAFVLGNRLVIDVAHRW